MSIIKYVSEGEVIPRGYGVAWGAFSSYGAPEARWVCLPLPINLICAWVRRLHTKMVYGLKDHRHAEMLRELEGEKMAQYQRGLAEGMAEFRKNLELLRKG